MRPLSGLRAVVGKRLTPCRGSRGSAAVFHSTAGVSLAVALAVAAVSASPAGAATTWKRQWPGDAGFSIVTPDDCGTVKKGTTIRLYGDTFLLPKSDTLPAFGTMVAVDEPADPLTGMFSIGGLKPPSLQIRSTSIPSLPDTAPGGAAPPAGSKSLVDTANRKDVFWPGAPFLIQSSYGNKGVGRCNLVAYGSLVRPTVSATNFSYQATGVYRRVWGMRLDVDVASLSSSKDFKLSYSGGTTDVSGVDTYSDSSYWDFGSAVADTPGLNYVFKTVIKMTSGGPSGNVVEVGLPDPSTGVPVSQGFIELPPGSITFLNPGSSSLSGSSASSRRGMRGSIVSDPSTTPATWWFVASPENYSRLVYAVQLKGPTGEPHVSQSSPDGGLYPSPTTTTNTVTSTTAKTAVTAGKVIAVKSAKGVKAGQTVAGAGVPGGTTVASVSGSNVTVSQNVTISSGTQLSFLVTVSIKYPAYQVYSFSGTSINSALTPAACGFYDPLIHQDMPGGLGADQFPLTFSANSDGSKTTATCRPPGSGAGNYGSYRIPTFWPLALKAAQSIVDAPLLARRARSAATTATVANGHLIIRMWPGKQLATVNSWLQAGEITAPRLSRRSMPIARGASVSATAAAVSPAVVMAAQPNYDIACNFLVPNTPSEFAAQQLAAARAEAAVLSALEAENATRILNSAQLAFDRAEANYLRSPTKGNAKAKSLAQAELDATRKRYGRVAALSDQRQQDSIEAQLAACGEGRTSWTD